jgi:hypothetical protein
MTKNNWYCVLPFLLLLLTGCTIVDSSSVLVGEKRAAIDASHVRIFSTPPANYEEVAIISAKAGHDFKSEQSLADTAMQRLKEEAAKVGANGVLLREIKSRDNPNVTTSYGTATAYGGGGSATASGSAVSVSRGDTYYHLSGIAIYVPTVANPQ